MPARCGGLVPPSPTVCCCAASGPSSFPSLSRPRGRAAQCHGTSCRLCRCAAFGPSSLPSLTGPRDWATVLQLLVPSVWPAPPLSLFRPGRCRRHADTATLALSGALQLPQPHLGGGSASSETTPKLRSRHWTRAAPVRDRCTLARWSSHRCAPELTSTRCAYMCLGSRSSGIDSAFRSGSDFGTDANLESVLKPIVSDELWAKIKATAQSAGLHVTLDLFATESNRRAERYCSRYGSPGRRRWSTGGCSNGA